MGMDNVSGYVHRTQAHANPLRHTGFGSTSNNTGFGGTGNTTGGLFGSTSGGFGSSGGTSIRAIRSG